MVEVKMHKAVESAVVLAETEAEVGAEAESEEVTGDAVSNKRKRVKALPSRIFVGGVAKPSSGEAAALQQIRDSHKYRNKLCELELLRRKEVNDVLLVMRPDLQRIENETTEALRLLDEAREAELRCNAEMHSKRKTTEVRDRLRGLVAALTAARKVRKAARAEAFSAADVKAALLAVASSDAARRKEAQHNSGLYWCNYLNVEACCKPFRVGRPPRFRAFDGSGRCAVQIQRGAAMSEIADGRCRLLSLAVRKLRGGPTHDKRSTGDLLFRVGSVGGKPIWFKALFSFAKLPPPDALVKWAWLSRVRVGTHFCWKLQLIASKPSWPVVGRSDDGVVGVDLGWRLMGDRSLRVAYWYGSDNVSGELRLPAERADALWYRPDRIRAERTLMFNQARDTLAAWLRGRDVPEWLRTGAENLAWWQSPARLARLVLDWRVNRFDGDVEMYERLDSILIGTYQRSGKPDKPRYAGGWRWHDKRMYDEESYIRRASINWRDELYRLFVRALYTRYKTVAIEDTNWLRMAVRAPVEEATFENETARRQRQMAAPGRLSALLSEGFASVVRVPAAHTTADCCDCGRRDAFDAGTELVRACRHCPSVRDQDERAAINLLRRSGCLPDGWQTGVGVAHGA